MKRINPKLISSLAILYFASSGQLFPVMANPRVNMPDTLPEICTVITPADLETIRPFTNPLSKTFPDPNNYETYNGCHFEFFKDNDYPLLAVRLIKWSSKKEAADDFSMQARSATDNAGVAPEGLPGIADSAFFNYDWMGPDKCQECGLTAISGAYSVYINFKGQAESVSREAKKEAALKILRLMYDRIPGLAQ